MRAYIQNINITTDGKVVVSGQLPSSNLKAKLHEHLYPMPPKDGIWDYTLEVIATESIGLPIMTPFSVEAPWTGNANSNGVRIIQSGLKPGEPGHETVQLKVKKVKTYTKEQKNIINIIGAGYNAANKQLIVDVRYSGGCFSHFFSLEWNGNSSKSIPPQYPFLLVDHSDEDPCEAIIECQLIFDINTPDVQLESPSIVNLRSLKGSGKMQVRIP